MQNEPNASESPQPDRIKKLSRLYFCYKLQAYAYEQFIHQLIPELNKEYEAQGRKPPNLKIVDKGLQAKILLEKS